MTDIERVRELCREKGIPIHALEKALGFSNGYLNPKKAKTISYERMMKIAAYLNVPISQIFMGQLRTDNKSPAPETEDEAERQELIRLYEAAPTWMQDQVRSLLKAAESAGAAPGDGPKE